MRQVQEYTALESQQPGVWYRYLVNGAGPSLYGAPPLMWTKNGFCHDGDFACLNDAPLFFINGYFGDCQAGNPAPCIESLEGRSSSSNEWVKGFVNQTIDFTPNKMRLDAWVNSMSQDGWGGEVKGVGDGQGWKQEESLNILSSNSAPMSFRIPGVLNAAGTDTYVVDSRYSNLQTIIDGKPKPQAPNNIYLNIRPYMDAGPSVTPFQMFRNGGPTGSLGVTGSYAFKTDSASGLAVAFNQSAEFRLTLRLPKDVSGWFHGRIGGTNATIEAIDAETNRVTISGKPVMVPITSVGWPFHSAEAEQFRTDHGIVLDSGTLDILSKFEAKNCCAIGADWAADVGLDQQFKNWEPYFSQVAKGQINVWSVSTINTNRALNPCLNKSDSLQGIITTNAMAYQGGVPTFKDGTLNYQVAGVHFDPNNQVFHGTYDLIMRSDAARCLYGFNSAPISATISVIDSAGDADVAVTSFAEKDGWLTLSAHNFTFSDPTISVKLEGQLLAPEPTPTSEATTGTSGTSVKTIKCVAKAKPYKTKTVKGKSPKCPKGYVKKSK